MGSDAAHLAGETARSHSLTSGESTMPVPFAELRTADEIDLHALTRHQARYFNDASTDPNPQIPHQPGRSEFPFDVSLRPFTWPTQSPWWRRLVCAQVEGDVVGHAILTGSRLASASHRCQLSLGVERRYRGFGIGRRLLNHLLTEASEMQQLEYVDLLAFSDNSVAIALYRSVGFRVVALRRDAYRLGGRSHHELTMELVLPDCGAGLVAPHQPHQ